MCRILAYLGEPLPVRNLLFDTDNGLVRQSYSPRMMNKFLNLAGFGMTAWDPTSLRPEQPFTYRATSVPSFDRNLRYMASKLAPSCVVAHVRGVTDSGEGWSPTRTCIPSISRAPVSSWRTTVTCGSFRACAMRWSSTWSGG